MAVEGVHKQLTQIIVAEWCEGDLLHCRSGLTDRFQLTYQGVGGIDLVVPIRANDQQVLQIVAGQHLFEEVECGGIQPLHVIEEKRERMFRSSEYADEPSKYQLETSLRFLRRQLGHRRLFANDMPQFRDEIDNE